MSRVLLVLWVTLASGAAARPPRRSPPSRRPHRHRPRRATSSKAPDRHRWPSASPSTDSRAGAGVARARTVSTDTDGNYEVVELPAGRYTVRVSRSGYVALSYTAQLPYRSRGCVCRRDPTATSRRGRARWLCFATIPRCGGEASRHVRAVRPSQTGEVEITGLRPGAYLAVAVEYLPDGDWFDPKVIASFRDRATRVTLGAETRRSSWN